VLENQAVPTVAVQGTINCGDASATDGKPALPGLTAAMVQRGTTTRTKEQIANLLESRGATLTISTTGFDTILSGSAMSKDARLLLEILADQLRNPAFPADELVKAKSELRSTILRNSENTTTRAIDRLSQLSFPASYPYRAAGHEALSASADAATVDDLKAFHEQRYVGAATVLSIVGDVDAKKTIALVEQLFGSMPKGARPATDLPRNVAADAAKREVVRMPGKANMTFVIGEASGLRRNDPDYEAALIANAALGQSALSSRIGKRVRDTEGLSYSLYSRYLMTDMLDGLFAVVVNVAPQNLEKALKSTNEEIVKYAREGANDDEIALAKDFFAGNYQVGLGSNTGVATALVTAEKFGYGPSYLDEYPKRIRRVTKEEVERVIKARLLPERLHLVVAGDIQEPPAM
jgi:zinc protease